MATLKELSKNEELLTGGHRLCAGCGASIVIRQMTLAIDKPVVISCATGCLEVATTIYPYTAWRCSFIHNAFENSAATISGVETAYKALKKRGKVTCEFQFIGLGGDGGTYDIGFQALSGVMERGHNILYICYDNEAYMNCLSTSSMIMTKDGLKKITDIKVGDEIYAFDQKTYQLVPKKCTSIFDNGEKEVFELQTLHHSIKATGNHPFLILKRNGRGRCNNFVWNTLENIKIGDEVVALKRINLEKSCKFVFKKVEKGDYKVNKLNAINIPETSSPDLMKYLGIYLGDGWTRSKRGGVDFAVPEGSQERIILVDLHSKLFGNSLKSDKNYVYINSVNLARFIDSLNFGNGAKNKTVPGWIFTLPQEEKEAFIEGLMLSDGYKINGSFRYVSASPELLKSLRLLLQTMGYRVGKIHWQTKKKDTLCVYRPLMKDSTYGYICFSKRRPWNTKKYPNQYKYQNFLIENEYFETEKVRSIKSIGIEPTLDLRVEDEHNFIADGIVVHNTGIQRSSATPLGADTTTQPVGKVIKGKKQFQKDLTLCMVAHKIPYAAQASPSHWNDLITKVKKALSIEGPKFINVLSPCPLGWGHQADETIDMARLAVETCFWPLYEVENGVFRLNYKPKEKLPITEWTKAQSRFKHLQKLENQSILDQLQKFVDNNWAELLTRCKEV